MVSISLPHGLRARKITVLRLIMAGILLLFPVFAPTFVMAQSPPEMRVVEHVQIKPAGDGAQIEISLSGAVISDNVRIFSLPGEFERVVIDFRAAKLGKDLESVSQAGQIKGGGPISQFRFAAKENTGLRLVADLAAGARKGDFKFEGKSILINVLGQGVEVMPDEMAANIVSPRLKPISVGAPGPREFDGLPYPRLKPQYPSTGPIIAATPPRMALRKPVIVIDPGHGGYDPGAIGTAKTKEEDITLAAANELKRQLMAAGKYEVVLTREKDIYIAHERRVRIAREAGAALFISIHADSAGSPSTRGASVYTLADRAHGRAQTIINQQNWVLDVDLTEQMDPVGDILVDLAQRKTLTKSAEFAEILIGKLRSRAKLVNNSHRRAGYYVLLAPDVPAVLLEMGFLSNSEDEKLLKTPQFRSKIMQGTVEAINLYFAQQSQLQASR